MWDEILRAFALVMIIEGILPFLSPARWKHMMYQALGLSNTALRTIGFVFMVSGTVLFTALA